MWKHAAVIFVLLASCSGVTDGEDVASKSQASVKAAASMPAYARIEATAIYHDDVLAVVSFFRPLGCIPSDFNLLSFFDMNAFSFGPETTEGWALLHEATDPMPYQVQIDGLGAVPVWFVTWEEMQGAVADGVLTLGELEALPSRVSATATRYHETLHPLGGANIGFLSIQASGVLDAGGRFHYSIMQRDEVGRDMVVNIKLD